MESELVRIGPRKSAVLLQSVAIVGFAIVAGGGLEWWGLLDSSPVGRLKDSVGLPLVGLAIATVGALIAGALAWSSLQSLIEVRPNELTIAGHLGRISLRYEDIEKVELLESRDVGLALRESSDWASRYEGGPEGLRKLQTLFGVMRAVQGCEIVLERDRIDVAVDQFVDLLRRRVSSRRTDGR